jgi:hypothetical protein
MIHEVWFWLYVATKFLGVTCPFTSTVGSVLGLIGIIARYVFIGMLFFIAPEWWYGLVMLAVEWFTPIIIPRVDVEVMSKSGFWSFYSFVGSHLASLLVVLVYLFYFKVI